MFHPLIFLKKLPQSPVFNLAAVGFTLVAAAPLFVGAVVDLSLSVQITLAWFERLVLVYFFLESLLRAFRYPSVRAYLESSTAWIDLISIVPALALLVYETYHHGDSIPGQIILRGGRVLRLIPLYQFFRQERAFGLRPGGSRLEFRLLGTSALLLYIFLLAGGTAMSFIHQHLGEEERASRILRVKRALDNQGLKGIEAVVPDRILKVEKRSPGESYEYYYTNREYIQKYMRPNQDFVYVEGSSPEEGVLLGLRDLNSRQNQFEASLLGTGLLMIGAIAILFHSYFRKRILNPVERARRVMELRILGEEIETTGIPPNIDNELTDLIDLIDRFYRRMRAPAKLKSSEEPESPTPLS